MRGFVEASRLIGSRGKNNEKMLSGSRKRYASIEGALVICRTLLYSFLNIRSIRRRKASETADLTTGESQLLSVSLHKINEIEVCS